MPESRDTATPIPGGDRSPEAAQGHWVLARLGKKVLRPGGVELTRRMLSAAGIAGADVVELAPGLGRTAAMILSRRPASYTGIDADPGAVATTAGVVGEQGTVHQAPAAATGLAPASADLVIGEAMLTMQGERGKAEIVAEVARILRPGGRYAIHELGLAPADVPEQTATALRQDLARAIKVNARPLTVPEWTAVLREHGLEVTHVDTADMALLQPRRILADEGLGGALRFAANLLRDRQARARVLSMRRTFRAHREHLIAVALVATKPRRS